MTDRQQQLLDDLNIIEDPQERLTIVVDRAKHHPPFSADQRIDTHRVPGCVSQVWLIPENKDGRCYFHCEADGPLVKGLVALLCDFFSDSAPEEIIACDTDPLAQLGLLRNLSPTRQNGLAAVRAAIKTFANSSRDTD